jgi:hypothetical protein
MSDSKQPPLGEVDPSEGSIQDPADQQSAQADDAEGQAAAGLEVDPSEQPSNE